MSETRRQFNLPEVDSQYLDSLGLKWETVISNSHRWVLVHQYPIPKGYNHTSVTVGLALQPSYPDTQIDMAYFNPHLLREDGKRIGSLTSLSFANENWQQWSRHRTPENQWRRGYDCIETHLLLVNEWLEREFRSDK